MPFPIELLSNYFLFKESQVYLRNKKIISGGFGMNKVVGFTISKKKIGKNKFDVFHTGLSEKTFSIASLYVHVWGIGDIDAIVNEKGFSLGFPPSNNLFDRNVCVSFYNDSIKIENDWLNSIPVFFNNKEVIVSTLCMKTLTDKICFDEEGVVDYLDFGYSVFGHTPIADVDFMTYYSELTVNKDSIIFRQKEDPLNELPELLKIKTDELSVLEKIQSHIYQMESYTKGTIVIPTSGGYDSRLLNAMIKGKTRVKAFSYGISPNQEDSSEVVKARYVCKKLGIDWKQIELNHFHDYVNPWFELYGFSTHLHGMYHIEFYNKMRDSLKNEGKGISLLSGIIGDAWAGRVNIGFVTNPKNLTSLGYTHGAVLPKKEQDIIVQYKKRTGFLKANAHLLKDGRTAVVHAMRLKLTLLSYLTIVPEYFGWPVWTPFLNKDIVFAMLRLPEEQRKNRRWQQKFFERNGLFPESCNLEMSNMNTLDYGETKRSIEKNYFLPLDKNVLTAFVKENYLEKINNRLCRLPTLSEEIFNKLTFRNRIFRGFLKLFGIPRNSHLPLRVSYMILKPLENVIKNGSKYNGESE